MTGKVIQGFFLGGQPKLAAVQLRIAAAPPIQAKTAAGSPGPPVTAFAARPAGPPAPAFAGRQGTVQRHGSGGAFAVEAGPLGLASGGGRPLPEAVRGKMEAALGADFANVRVHVGPQAQRIGAIAFTVGSDIYFAPGRYQPDTVHGQQLLGHELAHVVQQRAGRVRNPLGSGLAVVQDHALEAEADRLGQRAAMHRVAAQAKMPPAAAQPSAPVRISPPISAGPGSYRMTAGAGGRQVGSVMVHARDKGAVEVTDLHVAEAQRGHGIGRMLLASAARTGQQFGKSKVTLAAQDNGSGHLTQWYRGMGFAQVGVNQYGCPQLEAPVSRVLASTSTDPVSLAGGNPRGRIQTGAVQRARSEKLLEPSDYEQTLGTITVWTSPVQDVAPRSRRSYRGERVKQVLRWLSTLLFTRFRDGVEIQCYWLPPASLGQVGTIVVSSNVNSVNAQIKDFLSQDRGSIWIGLARLLVFAESMETLSPRQARHLRKIQKLHHYLDGAEDLFEAIRANNFEVPSEETRNGLHAERRIKKLVGSKGVLFDPLLLGGVKRPCLVCKMALDLNHHHGLRAGYLYGDSWQEIENVIDLNAALEYAPKFGIDLRLKGGKKMDWVLLQSRLNPDKIKKLILQHALQNGVITHVSYDRLDQSYTGGEDTDSESESEGSS